MAEGSKDALGRELAYHEELYSGFAQQHFAKPAVRALRAHMVARILGLTGAGAETRALSLGCGIGDTELLLAPRVATLVGVDLSPAAIRQATEDAERLGVANATFTQVDGASLPFEPHSFDLIFGIFFLHHLPDAELAALPAQVMRLLAPGGVFYSLDPSRRRLSGRVGRLIVPWMMKRYQTADERELEPEETARLFRGAGFETETDIYDFGSSPLAGLFPGWRNGYLVARLADDWLLGHAAIARLGSNFEIVARAPGA